MLYCILWECLALNNLVRKKKKKVQSHDNILNSEGHADRIPLLLKICLKDKSYEL